MTKCWVCALLSADCLGKKKQKQNHFSSLQRSAKIEYVIVSPLLPERWSQTVIWPKQGVMDSSEVGIIGHYHSLTKQRKAESVSSSPTALALKCSTIFVFRPALWIFRRVKFIAFSELEIWMTALLLGPLTSVYNPQASGQSLLILLM